MLAKLQKLLCLASLALTFNGCMTIQDARVCTVAGTLDAGGICSHMTTSETEDLDFVSFLDFLQPNSAKAGAICMSADDWAIKKIELETACRMLGKRCNFAVKKAIQGM